MLNSKGEYNRSRIARLSLGEMTKDKKPVLEEDKEAAEKDMEVWEGEKSDMISKKSRAEWKARNPLRKTTSRKKKEDDLTLEKEENTTVSSKRRKFEPIEEGCWGEVSTRLVTTVGIPQPYLPLQQRRVVGRRRGVRGGKVTRNYQYCVNDIRHFATVRAVNSDSEPKSKCPDRLPAFEDAATTVIDEEGEVISHDVAEDEEDDVFRRLETTERCEDDDKQQHEELEITPPRKEIENQKLKDEDNCKLSLDNNTSLLTQQSEHLTLQLSCRKRWRDRDTREEEETPNKRRKQEEDRDNKEEYYDRRGRLLTEMFGEVGKWCEECVMQPCVCVLNRLELRLVEERIRKLSSQKTTTPTTKDSPQDVNIKSPTTSGDPDTPTATTTTAEVGGSGKKVARVLKPWGLDCRKEDRVCLSAAGLSSITRRRTTGSPTTTTTTPKRLGTRMKVQNNSKKKVVKMTDDEKGRMMKTNKDIRGYFGATTTTPDTTKEESMLSGAPSFKTLLRAAEERSTMGKKVSEHLSKPNFYFQENWMEVVVLMMM